MNKKLNDLLEKSQNIEERLMVLIMAVPDAYKVEVEAYLKAIVDKALAA